MLSFLGNVQVSVRPENWSSRCFEASRSHLFQSTSCHPSASRGDLSNSSSARQRTSLLLRFQRFADSKFVSLMARYISDVQRLYRDAFDPTRSVKMTRIIQSSCNSTLLIVENVQILCNEALYKFKIHYFIFYLTRFLPNPVDILQSVGATRVTLGTHDTEQVIYTLWNMAQYYDVTFYLESKGPHLFALQILRAVDILQLPSIDEFQDL